MGVIWGLQGSMVFSCLIYQQSQGPSLQKGPQMATLRGYALLIHIGCVSPWSTQRKCPIYVAFVVLGRGSLILIFFCEHLARSNPEKTGITVKFKKNSPRNLPCHSISRPIWRDSWPLLPPYGINLRNPFSVIHPLFSVDGNNWSSGNSRVNHFVPQPPVPSASVPHMTCRFLAGMPWTSVWQYPSKRTLVSRICLQLGQYLCPPFRVSIANTSFYSELPKNDGICPNFQSQVKSGIGKGSQAQFGHSKQTYA